MAGPALLRGEHACHLFSTFEEQKDVVLPFFHEGLANQEHCIYITSQQTVEDWYRELAAYGIDTEAAVKRGALLVLDRSAWRPTAEFNTMLKAREAIGLFEGLLRDFNGVRIAGDAAWALDPQLPVEELCHWEATANLIYEGENLRAICQYDLTQHPAPVIHTALRTHALAIIDGKMHRNPYFEGAEILQDEPRRFSSDASPEMVDDQLRQIRVTAPS